MIFNNYAIEAGPFNSSHSLSPTAAGTHTNYNIMSEQSAAEYFLFSLYIFSVQFEFYILHSIPRQHSPQADYYFYIMVVGCSLISPPMSMLIFMQECTRRFLQKCFLIALKILFKCSHTHTCAREHFDPMAAVATSDLFTHAISYRYLWNAYWFLSSIFNTA